MVRWRGMIVVAWAVAGTALTVWCADGVGPKEGAPQPAAAAEATADRAATDAQAPPELRPIPEIKTTREGAPEGRPKGESAKTSEKKEPPFAGLLSAGDTPEVTVDDFEGGLYWKPVTWANANDCDVALATAAEGGSALALDCKPGDKGKAAAALTFPSAVDLSAFAALSLDVKVEGDRPTDVAIAFVTSAYYESVRAKLQEGWNRGLKFSLEAQSFKTSPEWEYKAALQGASRVSDVFVVIYYDNGRRVMIDNVRLLRKGPKGE